VPIEVIQNRLIQVFEKRNRPGSFRVDNGEPFGSPANDTPPPLALWLIGYDIDMIWNKPRCPQMNGVVERLQQTSSRWAEIESCSSYEELQDRLDHQATIQRSVFPVSRLKHQTRLEAFPSAEKSDRIWEPLLFCPQRVYDFLAKKIFTRKISSGGHITHFNKPCHGLRLFKGQFVQLSLNPKTLEWQIIHDYQLIKSWSVAQYLTEERLLNLTIFQ
jgi:hypothetical protein